MDAYSLYQSKMKAQGSTPTERSLKLKIRDFERYFYNTPDRELATVIDRFGNSKDMDMVFQDHSQSNNKQLSDDKYIVARNQDIFNVGDYVRWRGDSWLVFTKEFKTIPSHQQGLIKNNNAYIRWIRNGEVVNGGRGYPAYVTSQTLYTMGVSQTTYMNVPDGKMMMYMQNNQDTIDIRQDERVVISGKVFKVKFTDYVSRQGLISYLMDEDRTHEEYDNMELGVADYYKYYNKGTDYPSETEPSEPENPSDNLVIVGEQKPKVGTIHTYKANFDVAEWVMDDGHRDSSYRLSSINNDLITIEYKDDYRYIGEAVNIIARSFDDEYASLPIIINKRF